MDHNADDMWLEYPKADQCGYCLARTELTRDEFGNYACADCLESNE